MIKVKFKYLPHESAIFNMSKLIKIIFRKSKLASDDLQFATAFEIKINL